MVKTSAATFEAKRKFISGYQEIVEKPQLRNTKRHFLSARLPQKAYRESKHPASNQFIFWEATLNPTQ